MIAAGDPLLYQVYNADLPDAARPTSSSARPSSTRQGWLRVLHDQGPLPRRRAHRRGLLLPQGPRHHPDGDPRQGDVAVQHLERGKAVYIPPGWAHRSVNVGSEEFIFFFAYPGGAGHDYEAFEGLGFRNVVIEREGRAVVAQNPRFA